MMEQVKGDRISLAFANEILNNLHFESQYNPVSNSWTISVKNLAMGEVRMRYFNADEIEVLGSDVYVDVKDLAAMISGNTN